MDGDCEGPRGIPESGGGSVALMHIEVEDCDPFDILSFQCDFGTDRDVVEDAVARPKVSMGVMGPSRHVPGYSPMLENVLQRRYAPSHD